MPRIVPIQLLKCLKVLLNPNGGILSQGEVKRISCLMTKYSKKLVSKCIYVQILKCTDTELLDEFMRVGGWNLVFAWLNDGIRLSNWPLVQEIVELLLLCPVDVNRLKTNSAPKTVKGLSNNGGTEAVRILADRLVKQWLKVVTEGNEQAAQAKAAAADAAAKVTANTNTAAADVTAAPSKQSLTETTKQEPQTIIVKPAKAANTEDEDDPLYVPESTSVAENLTPTPAQKKGMKSGLVYKIVVKDGKQLLSKVETSKNSSPVDDEDSVETNDEDAEVLEEDTTNTVFEEDEEESAAAAAEVMEEDSTSFDKPEEKESSKVAKERKTSVSSDTKVKVVETSKSESRTEERKSSKDSKSSKEHKGDKDKERKSSSTSSSHRSSSSSHKSSSKSSSSSSKSKSSSSSSSSHRSSTDKHRSDRDRSSSSSSSSKDKSNSSSSSSKHKSSSKSSSGSSSKDRHRDKDKEKSSSSSSSSKKDKEREKEVQAEKDKDTLAKMLPPSLDKLGKIPKKPRDDKDEQMNVSSTHSSSSSTSTTSKPTSITIPSKKASISIEIRRDAEKSSAVKTYKSQFRSHGLTEEAPPPPSRKTLKKPGSSSHSSGSNTPQPGTVIPTSLPSSLKRPSPPPRESPVEKKPKIDVNSIAPAAATAAEKPGAIKLIPPKRIQTLVETNLFSDALSAATGPKKVTKRKRPSSSGSGKDEPTTPTSPDAAKVAPLKFYQDTLDESAKTTASGVDKNAAEDKPSSEDAKGAADDSASDKDSSAIISLDDDDDIPLKKVKEDIEQRVRNQKKVDGDEGDTDGVATTDRDIEILSDTEDANSKTADAGSSSPIVDEVRKPGPGCGPDGPPGVLMLHRRKGPKKKLTWRPQETLEQIRYFEMDETERVNVMKVSFFDAKNKERLDERNILTGFSKRGPRPGDNQEPRTEYRPLIEIDDVPVHPDGAQSRERKVQADREMTTLRALYFSPNMIPDSPSEAELEPHSLADPPTIPLDDITGNPDAVNDFSAMPWPEPKGTPRNNENSGSGGLGSLGNAADMFGALNAATVVPIAQPAGPMPTNPFSNYIHPYGAVGNAPGAVGNMMPGGPPQMQISPNGWQGPPPMMGNPFQGPPNPDLMMGGGPRMNFMGPQSGPGYNGPLPPPPFMSAGSPPFGPPGFMQNGPNFGPMGPGPNGPPMMNNMGPGPGPMNGPRGGDGNGGRNNNHNNRNNSNWVHGGGHGGSHKNFRDKDSWRPAGSGNNNGVCKSYMRGNCNNKNCKYVHPKSRR